ncbi:MAG: hypothetical protein WBE20_10900 [Candidatus Acidiferrales bacterium]
MSDFWFRRDVREFLKNWKAPAYASPDLRAAQRRYRELIERLESEEGIGFIKGESPRVFN